MADRGLDQGPVAEPLGDVLVGPGQDLIPRLLRREQEIMSCLSAQERKDLAALLGKIEKSLDLVQTSREADEKEAY